MYLLSLKIQSVDTSFYSVISFFLVFTNVLITKTWKYCKFVEDIIDI